MSCNEHEANAGMARGQQRHGTTAVEPMLAWAWELMLGMFMEQMMPWTAVGMELMPAWAWPGMGAWT